jgi:hypothetical protein
MITQDQMVAQLRVAIPAIGTIISAFGLSSSTQVAGFEQTALVMVGPISYLIVAIWSFIANSKSSIIKSAAGMIETQVKPSADGTKVVITTSDPTLVAAATSVPQSSPPKE